MSNTSIGKIKLDLVVNKNDFKKQVSGINSLAKKTGTLLAAAFSVKKLVDFGQACLDLGSDLQEVQNVVDVTFPNMSAQIDEFTKDAAASFGLSETMAKQFSGTFGSMAKAFGFAEEQAYEMSTTLTGLAGDVASFYNLTQEEAYTKLKSVFTGETESLKDLGVVMTQSALDSYALANGFGKTTSAMSEAEKVALRYAFVQEQLSAASGDFIRTSDGWANQIRVLKLQFDSLKATIGQGLINVLTPVVKMLNTILAKLQAVADSFKSFTENLLGIDASDTTSSVSSDLASAASSSEDITSELKNAAKAAKSMAGFDELNKLSDTESTSIGTSSLSSISLEMSVNESTAEKTKSWISGFFEAVKVNIDFSKTSESLKGLKENLLPFAEGIGEGLLWLFTDVLVPLSTWTVSEVVPRFLETLSSVIGVLNPIIEALKPLFQWFWDELLAPLASWAGDTFLEAWDSINEALNSFSTWCSENPEVIQTIATIITSFAAAFTLVTTAMKIWNTVTAITTAVTTGFSAAISFLTSPIGIVVVAIGALIAIGVLLYKNWDTVKDFILTAWEAIKTGIENAIEAVKNTLSSIMEKIKTTISNVWNGIKQTVTSIVNGISTWISNAFNAISTRISNVMGNIKNTISNIWQTIKSTVSSVVGGISTAITSAFSKVKTTISNILSGIKNTFSNVFNALLGIVKKPINAIIKVLNSLIGGLNKISFDIPDWVPLLGGKKFGFNIPEIPMLAQGGYVRANTPQLAVIGDNRHQGEVVAPEGKMQEMADAAAIKAISALEDYMAAMMAGFEAVVQAIKDKDTNVVIGDEQIGKANGRYAAKMAVITGGT